MLSTKVQAWIAGLVGGMGSFIAWFINTPPEQQSGWLAQLVELVPVNDRPSAALFAKTISTCAGFYAIYKASHSGPSTPPFEPNPTSIK